MKAEDIFQRFTRSAQEAVMKLRVRSALNPCLFLCGIISLPCFGLARYSNGALQIFFVVLGGIPVLIFGIGFIYFMLKDPDKLQSEEYQIQKRALELIEQKGESIPIDVTSIVEITNPKLREIGNGDVQK